VKNSCFWCGDKIGIFYCSYKGENTYFVDLVAGVNVNQK